MGRGGLSTGAIRRSRFRKTGQRCLTQENSADRQRNGRSDHGDRRPYARLSPCGQECGNRRDLGKNTKLVIVINGTQIEVMRGMSAAVSKLRCAGSFVVGGCPPRLTLSKSASAVSAGAGGPTIPVVG